MKRLITRQDITADEASFVTPDGDQARSSVLLVISVTSLTGTVPTLDVQPRTNVDGVITALTTTPALTQFSGAANQVVRIDNCPTTFEINLAFGGTVTDCDLTISGERV